MTAISRMVLGLALLTPAFASAADWTNWRGPERNGVSRETGLPDNFNNILWQRNDVSCRSTPVVMNGRVYVINKVGDGAEEQERVVCMDAKTGKDVWEHRFGVFFTPIVSVRLGWTEPFLDPETGNLYVHGTQGLLFCFDGKTGKVLWQKSLTEEYGRITGYGGRVASPIVDGNVVIVGMVSSNWGSHAGGGCRFFGFNKKTGEVIWTTSTGLRPSNTYRCVPVATTINGERIFITGGADGNLHAFQVNTGKKVWSYEFGIGAINPSPVIDGNLIYAAHGEEIVGRATVGRMICLDAGKLVKKPGGGVEPTLVWDVDDIEFKHASPTLFDGKICIPHRYCKLYCVDAKKGFVDGDAIWVRAFGRETTSSPVYADGKIYLASVSGYFVIINAKTGAIMARQPFKLPGIDVEAQGSAAIANGCVYLGTTQQLFCFGKYNEVKVDVPAQPAAPGPNPKGTPAQLQVVPAEVSLNGGESVQFKARLFDDKGRFIRETKGQYKLAAMARGPGLAPGVNLPNLKGELTEDGKLTLPKFEGGQSGRVTVTADGLEAFARVRQVPPFPYKEDFESVGVGTIPGGWTNHQLRYVTTKLGNNTVLMKTVTIAVPFYRQWYAFIGTPEQKDYTIEADVMGEKVGNDLPNVGVTANRYILQLVGNEQKLRLSAWDAMPRVAKEINFPHKANQWYRIKLTVEKGKNGNANVLGKVWPQGVAEPEKWTIELSDPNPNLTGPPGLYGSALGINPPKEGTKIYYDNVVVK